MDLIPAGNPREGNTSDLETGKAARAINHNILKTINKEKGKKKMDS